MLLRKRNKRKKRKKKKENVPDMPTGHSDRGNSATEDPTSQVTLKYVKFTITMAQLCLEKSQRVDKRESYRDGVRHKVPGQFPDYNSTIGSQTTCF